MCGPRLGKNFVMLLQHWSGAVMRLAFFLRRCAFTIFPHGHTQSIRPGAIIKVARLADRFAMAHPSAALLMGIVGYGALQRWHSAAHSRKIGDK